MQEQLAALAGSPEFLPWVQDNPTFKPRLSGLLSTAQGVSRVTILLDTGTTHCFICARLAVALGLPPSGQPGQLTVATAARGGAQGLGAPVLIHLSLGDSFRELMSISPMDMDVGDDLILGWDWISSHNLHNLFQAGQVGLRSGLAQLQLALLPAAARPAPVALSTVIGHGELHCLLCQIVSDDPPAAQTPCEVVDQGATARQGPPGAPWRSKGWSRPVQADHAELAALEAAERSAARERRRYGGPSRAPPRLDGRFAEGVEVLRDGTELHLASFCLADVELCLAGDDDDAAFAALKVEYADVLAGAQPWLPPERGMELVIETGDALMQRSRPVKRLSEGGLAELRTQLVDLLDHGWIQHSNSAKQNMLCRWCSCGSPMGRVASATTTGASMPSAGRLWSRSRTSTRCLTGRWGSASSPSSTSPAATSAYHQLLVRASDLGCRVSCSSWASSNGTWCPSGCKDCCLS